MADHWPCKAALRWNCSRFSGIRTQYRVTSWANIDVVRYRNFGDLSR